MKRKPGFILITTVLTLLALAVTLTLALASFSLGSTGRALALGRGEKSLALADGCMEEVLFRIRENPAFDEATIELDAITCDVDVQLSGNDYTVTTSVTSDDHTRSVTAKVVRDSGGLLLSSWNVE